MISHLARFCGGREERANYPHCKGGELRETCMFMGFGNTELIGPTPAGGIRDATGVGSMSQREPTFEPTFV